MSDSSAFFPSGGKRRIQRFTTSGTFTPSPVHLARGGVTTITYSAGGGSGALNRITSGSITPRASGGDAGQRIRRTVVLAGPVTHVIGSGGAARVASGTVAVQVSGNDGSDTTVTGLPTAKGGKGGLLSGASTGVRGGRGAGSPGLSVITTTIIDARGGAGIDGANGGGGGTPDTTVLAGGTYVYGATGQDGGGDALIQPGVSAGTTVTGNSAAPNSGAGGGATAVSTVGTSDNITASSGAGADGWIEYEWEE